ncbi:MAG: hypothetical protein AVDCRST_MAG75-1786 [uncultured Propionibacteriaceae bacterium]|uniref:Beta-galactosidase trimerisation domain-containing protein n=1 Tax=uncultured Propionibacteriaceae bacterium TaxID=257457 RepID=A0A6J4NRP8_9ACTN|nr:MAG: hypothetical protein AVDCRST_MAG75-1786 [uncultured Propionibacteriaceae bacterium]
MFNARDTTIQVPYRVVTESLSRAAVPFDVVLVTDGETAADRIDVESLRRYRSVVLPHCWWLSAKQADAMVQYLDGGGRIVITGECATTLDAEQRGRLLSHVGVLRSRTDDLDGLLPDRRQVTVTASLAVNIHELASGAYAVHLVNYDYDAGRDAVSTYTDVELSVRLPGGCSDASLITPGLPDQPLVVKRDGDVHTVRLDQINLYSIVVLHREPTEFDGQKGVRV